MWWKRVKTLFKKKKMIFNWHFYELYKFDKKFEKQYVKREIMSTICIHPTYVAYLLFIYAYKYKNTSVLPNYWFTYNQTQTRSFWKEHLLYVHISHTYVLYVAWCAPRRDTHILRSRRCSMTVCYMQRTTELNIEFPEFVSVCANRK